MRAASPRLRPALSLLAAASLLAGCGKSAGESGGGPSQTLSPIAVQGAVSVATGNTTRVGGASAITDAAAIARAVYPGLTPATRPQAVILVNASDYSAALAASVLSGAPISAPVLFSEGETLPEVSRQAIEALHPVGVRALGGAQVIRIGTRASIPGGYLTRTPATAASPSATAASIEHLLLEASASAPSQAIVLPANAPAALMMPAAGLSAESGAPILFVSAVRVPQVTDGVLAGLHHPSIYVIGARKLSRLVLGELRHFGPVTVIGSGAAPGERPSATANSIAVARFTDGSFGWGVKEPGHGLVFANAARPLDAPAAALLSARADYGPLLLLGAAAPLPSTLAAYLRDIQPGYTAAPGSQAVKGVYNHGWLIGDESAISALTQAEIDPLLEIAPRRQAPEESPAAPLE